MGAVADEILGRQDKDEKKRKPKLLKDMVDGKMPPTDDQRRKVDGVNQQVLGDRG